MLALSLTRTHCHHVMHLLMPHQSKTSQHFVCIPTLLSHVPPGVLIPQFRHYCFRWRLLRTGRVYAKFRGIKNKWKAFFWGKGGHQVGVLSTFILQYDQYPIIFKCVWKRLSHWFIFLKKLNTISIGSRHIQDWPKGIQCTLVFSCKEQFNCGNIKVAWIRKQKYK